MMQYLKKAKERTAEDHRKLRQTVSEIIENVCESGDRALHEYSRRFDESDRASFRVSREDVYKRQPCGSDRIQTGCHPAA